MARYIVHIGVHEMPKTRAEEYMRDTVTKMRGSDSIFDSNDSLLFLPVRNSSDIRLTKVEVKGVSAKFLFKIAVGNLTATKVDEYVRQVQETFTSGNMFFYPTERYLFLPVRGILETEVLILED